MNDSATNVRVVAIDHVQIAMPEGRLEEARDFYVGVLGLAEGERPESISRAVGLWFTSGTVKVHLGVEPAFRPSRKAHTALVVENADELFGACRARGLDVVPAADLDGFRRAHVLDPFGNRIEIVERT